MSTLAPSSRPRRWEIALALVQDAEQTPRRRLVGAIAGRQRRLQGIECVGARRLDRSPLDLGERPKEQQAASEVGIRDAEIECAGRVTTRLVERANVDRPLRGIARTARQPAR